MLKKQVVAIVCAVLLGLTVAGSLSAAQPEEIVVAMASTKSICGGNTGKACPGTAPVPPAAASPVIPAPKPSPAPTAPTPSPVTATPVPSPAPLPAPAPVTAPPAPVSPAPVPPVTVIAPPAPPAPMTAPAPVSPAPTPVVVTPPIPPPAPVVAPVSPPNAPTPTSSYKLVASASSVAAGANITATWTAPSGSSGVDWVGLYKVGDPNKSYILNKLAYTNGAKSGSYTTTAPTTPGTYEFRYLLDDGYTDTARSSSITVTATVQQSTPTPTPAPAPTSPPTATYTLSVSPASANAGASMSLTWTAPSGSSGQDWVGLFQVGASNTAFDNARWVFTNGQSSGIFTTTAPSTTGTYEFRYLLSNGYTDVKRSASIAVSAVQQPTPPVVTATPPPSAPAPQTPPQSVPTAAPSPVASAPAPSNSASGPGVIQIVRLGECTGTGSNGGFACAPYASAWVDSRQPMTTNPATFSNMSNGSRTVSVTFIHGLPSMSAGTCTGSGCSVSSFNLPLTCDDTRCSINVTVHDDSTQIAIKYASDYQGGGASITGGKDKPISRVTNLNDSGPGSLRDACLAAKDPGGAYIVFDVMGTINQDMSAGGNLNGAIMCIWPNVTVDGFTAPGGITLPNSLIIKDATYLDDYLHPGWWPHTDAHNIVFRNIAINRPRAGGFQSAVSCLAGQSAEVDYTNEYGKGQTAMPHHLVWSHMTLSGTDVSGASSTTQMTTTGCRDMLIEWNMLRDPRGELTNFISSAGLAGFYPYRQALHHNLFAPFSWRNPAIVYYSLGGCCNQDPITADVRLNLIYVGMYTWAGTTDNASCSMGAKCNFVKNYTLGSPYALGKVDDWWTAFCSEFGYPYDPIGTKTCGGRYSSSGGGNISNQNAAAAGFYLSGNVWNSAYNAPATIDRNQSSYRAGNPPAPFPIGAITEEATAEEAACNIIAYAGSSPRNADDMKWVNSAISELAKFYTCGTP